MPDASGANESGAGAGKRAGPNEPLSSLNVGGQAVLEGVMMRSPGALAIAVRKRDGGILLKDARWESLSGRWKFLRWPVLRGAVVFVEALVNGMAAMRFSAEQMEVPEGEGGEGNERGKGEAPSGAGVTSALLVPWTAMNAVGDGAGDAPAGTTGAGTGAETGGGAGAETGTGADAAAGNRMSKAGVWISMIVGIGLALLVFKGLPHLLTWLLTSALHTGITVTSPWFHLIDGVIKAGVFVGYIVLITRLPDIKRVFQYHGAEHKVIWAWEKGAGLTVAAAQAQTRRHPRCGTSFLLLVILVSIAVFAAAFPLLQPFVTFTEVGLVNNLVYIAVKIPLMLPVAGLAYELVRFSGKNSGKAWIRPLLWPGLAMQGLTTREPDDTQVEIALAALRRALWREKEQRAGRTEGAEGAVLTFARAEDIPLPEGGIEAAFPAAA